MPNNTTFQQGLQDLEAFVIGLITEKGFKERGIAEPVLEQLRADLFQRVVALINTIIVDSLPDDKLDAYENLLSSNPSQQAIEEFCKNNIPDLSRVLGEGMNAFRNTYLGLAS